MSDADVKKQIKDLKSFADQLREALDEIGHEIRRCRDALERHGGRSPEYERRMRILQDNAKLNIKELRDAEELLSRLLSQTSHPSPDAASSDPE